MSSDTGAASVYVVETTFESDDQASGLAKANAWLTLQGKGVELQTVVGDSYAVSVYYTMRVEAPAKVRLDTGTGSVTTIGPGSYTTTNGAVA